MWPWEHAAVGYLLYSLYLRVLGHDPPAERETILILLATQTPDLIDKPLSWGLGWFPSGYAVGHSMFVAIPIGLLILALGTNYGFRRNGIAVVLGYWSHLLTDVLEPLRGGSAVLINRVLWPVVEATPYETDLGIARGFLYIVRFLTAIPTMDLTSIVLVYILLPVGSAVVWLLDGAPGAGLLRRSTVAVWRRGVAVVRARTR